MRKQQSGRPDPYNLKAKDATVKYTNGGEYVIDVPGTGIQDVAEYFGFYYVTKQGSMFIGSDPSAQPRIKLRTIPKSAFEEKNAKYWRLTHMEFDRYNYPVYYYPRPTAADYKLGYITRRFVKKVNEEIISEIKPIKLKGPKINGQNLKGLNSFYWRPIQFRWSIVGPIEEVRKGNKRVLDANEKYFPGITRYLNDLDEFHKDKPIFSTLNALTNINNLQTEGGEYTYENGLEYIGPYHIHPKKGPMVGSKHSDQPHELLYPINDTSINNLDAGTFGQQSGY